MTSLRYLAAMREAVRAEMSRDPSVFMIGEDLREGVRGVSTGLAAEFGADRVLDTPISEQAFTSFALGTALMGMRPIVEFQIPSLLFIAFEQIVNQAQKVRLMSGGQVSVPVTFIVPGSGARRGLAAQHSDHPYTLFAHMGVKTVIPATADDAYGLMLSAIRDDDPVLYFAPAAVLARKDEVPKNHQVPIGQACVRRSGTDLTIVAIGHLVHEATTLADRFADGGPSIEVIDPRTVLPLDLTTIRDSVARTGRLIVYDDANRDYGFGAEIVASVVECPNVVLKSPPIRITRANVPVAFSLPMESYALPSSVQLERAIEVAMGGITLR